MSEKVVTKIKRFAVATFYERLYCPCGGEMKWEGMTLTVDPPLFPHVCERCGGIDNRFEHYPGLKHDIRGEIS